MPLLYLRILLKIRSFVALIACIFSVSKGQASTLRNTSFDNPDLLSFGLGIFNMIKDPTHVLFQFEYKRTFSNFKKARPIFGAFTTEQLSTYLYAGVGYDIFIFNNIVFTPSFSAGIYFPGYGRKLYFPLEYRSSAELAYVLKNKNRIGAQFYHISNASIGRKNPGVEALVVSYSIAL